MKHDWTGGRASVFKTIGASNHCEHPRQAEDYYATEPLATQLLLQLERFDHHVLEPSCGEGHISEVLRDAGYDVTSRDLVDRGYGEVADFLAIDNVSWHGDIITNPPYRYAQEFVEKALCIIPDGNKVAMFLKLTFLEGKSRRKLFRTAPPRRCTSRPHASSVPSMVTLIASAVAPQPTPGLCGRKDITAIR